MPLLKIVGRACFEEWTSKGTQQKVFENFM